jgi:hypothetical protein
VILSARTSQGAADNLRSVNQGLVDSGLAQGDVVAAAVAGRDVFRRSGRALHLRVIASLFSEQAHLVVAEGSKIGKVADLRGKRLALGNEGSGAAITGREILAAWNLTGRVRLVAEDGASAAQLLQSGKIDAFFTVAGVPLDAVKDLIARHQARLVPIDGEGRDRLIKMVPQLAPAVIAANAYPGTPATETVSTRAFWVARDSAPDSLIYGVTRALFNAANQGALAASHPSARDITLHNAPLTPPAILHPGAARFYREAGVIPAS